MGHDWFEPTRVSLLSRRGSLALSHSLLLRAGPNPLIEWPQRQGDQV